MFIQRTTRAEPEDYLWSADHSLGNAALDYMLHVLEQQNEGNKDTTPAWVTCPQVKTTGTRTHI
jgi:hypothetical protein